MRASHELGMWTYMCVQIYIIMYGPGLICKFSYIALLIENTTYDFIYISPGTSVFLAEERGR